MPPNAQQEESHRPGTASATATTNRSPNNRSNSKLLSYEHEDQEVVARFEKKGYRNLPIFYVNGKRLTDEECRQARSNQTTLSFLRDVLGLTGSKLGCAEGGCGACTVMISTREKQQEPSQKYAIRHVAVNACLMPILAADGCHITTIEGIGSLQTELHPLQQAMTDLHGSQCGYCTPGIIVSMYSLYAANHHSDTNQNTTTTAFVEEHLDGNLCRCTGYRPIWDAARSFAVDAVDQVMGPCGTPCVECPEHDTCEQDCNVQVKEKSACSTNKANSGDCCSSSSQDKMKLYSQMARDNKFVFPSNWWNGDDNDDAILLKEEQPLVVVDQSDYQRAGSWFKPTTLEELLMLLKEFGDTNDEEGSSGYKLVVGNTEVGIETRFKNAVYPRLIYPSTTIVSLYAFDVALDKERMHIGACTPLSTIQHRCRDLASAPASTTGMKRTVQPIHDMLRWFASTQIRNVASLGGNLVTASPISDMNPLLASMGATLVLAKMDGAAQVQRRTVPVSEFFVSYRKVAIQSNEIVETIQVPVLAKVLEYVIPFKQARRREDDISIVTAGMYIRLSIESGTYVIKTIALAFGGMAPKTILAPQTAEQMTGQPFAEATFVKARESLMEEIKLPHGVPGGQAAYRMTLAASFLYKFYLILVGELQKDVEAMTATPGEYETFTFPLPQPPCLSEQEESGTQNFLNLPKPSMSGVQSYPLPKVAAGLEETLLPSTDDAKGGPLAAKDAVGISSVHQSGSLHCTGEAVYTDDIPLPPRTLQAALILAKECGRTLEMIDDGPALNVPGVVGVFTAVDIDKLGGKNELGPIVKDETIFTPVGSRVNMVGQPLGVVVAETLEAAELGARMVEITYTGDASEVVMTIEDAIRTNSYYDSTRHELVKGDTSIIDGLKQAVSSSSSFPKAGDVITVEGSFRSGAQEHFYLECNSTLVVPSESATNLTIYSSTQAATKTQMFCAYCTGIPAAKVVVRVKRLGGGFGGKETRSVFAACAAAIASKHTSRPVRLTLPRNVDMLTTGQRHAFLSTYTASAILTGDGSAKLQAMDIKLYNNAGSGMDLSGPVMDRACFHVDSVYSWPHLRVEGVCCKTSQAPHTAFRGFGGPQGMTACEHVIEHLAVACHVPTERMRRDNIYQAGDYTHFGMVIGNSSGSWNVPSMWDDLEFRLDLKSRRGAIATFNSENKWLQRGSTLVPTKFGIAFTAKFMNQGGALVHLYTDGTVLVSHGGTEMGQGLHTKVCQVAAQSFGIPVEHVYISDSSTDKVANTIPTAASMSTDLYGMSTLNACRQIMERLKPVREKLGPHATLAQVAQAAHFERIDLSAHGFYAPDGSRVSFDFLKEKPDDYPDDAPDNAWKGHPFNYFTQGVAYAEVEVDMLTGNHRTLRTDVLVDVGSSINPSIDIGQIEGAFAQGMGWSTIEDVAYGDTEHSWVRPRGNLFTAGPGTYKIPAFNDQPEVFNMSLLGNSDNPFAVHSSKAVGEPPFFLGTSVYYAIKDAIQCFRTRNGDGKQSYLEMRLPLTSERIRMYADDEIGMQAKQIVVGESAKLYQPQGSF